MKKVKIERLLVTAALIVVAGCLVKGRWYQGQIKLLKAAHTKTVEGSTDEVLFTDSVGLTDSCATKSVHISPITLNQ